MKVLRIIMVVILLAGAGLVFAMVNADKPKGGAMLAGDGYYEKFKIQKDKPAVWEDGMRTHGGKGTYEWWYVDAEFENGMTIVVVFYSKNHFDVKGPPCPTVTINITFADGRVVRHEIKEGYHKSLKASKSLCDVSIGGANLKYDNGDYKLTFKEADVTYEVVMRSTLPMWRPDTGHWYFGDEQKNYFAWFVAQPSSVVHGSLKVGEETFELEGKGYHDHNWGNVGMHKVMNHWYWGRASLGEYTLIACDIVSEKAYGYRRLPVIMIAENGRIIADDQSRTRIAREGTHEHPVTGKFMDDHLTFTQPSEDGGTYKIEYIREKDILSVSLLTTVSTTKRIIAKLLGGNPTYTRIVGKVRLTVTESDGKSITHEDEGLWEQMFFGKNKTAIINFNR